MSDYSFVLSGNEGTADEFTAVLWYSPDEDYDFMVGGQVDADGSTAGFAYGSGAEMKTAAVYADDTSVEAGWVAASEAGAADTLYLSVNDGEDNIYITADMTRYTETISVDEIDAILNAEGVDVLTIDDAALDTLMTELSEYDDCGDGDGRRISSVFPGRRSVQASPPLLRAFFACTLAEFAVQ